MAEKPKHTERERVPFSGDPDDPEGNKKENAAKRHEEERKHGHK